MNILILQITPALHYLVELNRFLTNYSISWPIYLLMGVMAVTVLIASHLSGKTLARLKPRIDSSLGVWIGIALLGLLVLPTGAFAQTISVSTGSTTDLSTHILNLCGFIDQNAGAFFVLVGLVAFLCWTTGHKGMATTVVIGSVCFYLWPYVEPIFQNI